MLGGLPWLNAGAIAGTGTATMGWPCMEWNKRRSLMLGIAVVVVVSVWVFGRYEQEIPSIYSGANWCGCRRFMAAHPVLFPLAYFLAYVVALTILIPADMLMMLLAGALFGLGLGSVLSCTAHTVGATINFAASRFLFKRMKQPEPKSSAATKSGCLVLPVVVAFHPTRALPWHQPDDGSDRIERDGIFYRHLARLFPDERAVYLSGQESGNHSPHQRTG